MTASGYIRDVLLPIEMGDPDAMFPDDFRHYSEQERRIHQAIDLPQSTAAQRNCSRRVNGAVYSLDVAMQDHRFERLTGKHPSLDGVRKACALVREAIAEARLSMGETCPA